MKQRNSTDDIVNGVAWKFGERILSQGVAFLISVILARLLTPEDYGTIALVLIFINLADVFVNSGFATSLIQKKNADELDFSTIFYCSVFCSALIYGILFFCAPWIASFYENPFMELVIRVFSLRIPLSTFYTIQCAYVSRHMLFRSSFFASLFAQVISGACGIFMALNGFGVWALIAQYFANTIVTTLVLLAIVPWRPKWLFSLKRARMLMKFGSRILIADLSGTFFNELRSLITGRVYTEADLAFYNKGQQLPQLVATNLNVTIMTVLFPAMANEVDNLYKIKRMTKRGLQCLAYVTFPVLLGLAAVMEPLINVLYTSKWEMSIFFGQIYCIGYAVGTLGIIPVQVLKAIGQGDAVLKLEIYKKPMYLFLLIIGVSFGMKEVAITMLIYEVYGTIVNLIQMKRYIDYTLKEIVMDLLPTLLLAGAMFVVVVSARMTNRMMILLLIRIVIGVGIFAIGSVVLKLPGYQYLLQLIQSKLRR